MNLFATFQCFVLAAGFFVCGQAYAQYTFESKFGTTGTAAGELDDPRGLALDSEGRIVIAENINHRVSVCTYSGNCSVIGGFGTGAGSFDRPRGVAVNAEGRIFVADYGNDRIQSCTDTGACSVIAGAGTATGEFISPSGIAVAHTGELVIADTGNDRIQICSEAGECTTFGSSGTATGQFDGPTDVAVDSQGRIIVADYGNHRIQICSAQGACTAFGSTGESVGQFEAPSGVDVDSQDLIVVVERGNDRVQVCSDTGSCTAFGGFGLGDGEFFRPWGGVVDDEDRIIVSGAISNRIQIFAPPLAIRSFALVPDEIYSGQSVTLDWTVNGANSCAALDGVPAWNALSPANGTDSAVIPITGEGEYTFTLECTDGADTESASAEVNVLPVVGIDAFTASAATIAAGESVTLTWAVSNATSCTALDGTSGWAAITPDAAGGSAEIGIEVPGEYTFTLECTDGQNTASANVVVSVIPEPVVSIDNFAASASVIIAGESVTLSWSVSNATSCSALNGTPDWTAVSPDVMSGNVVMTIEQEGAYTFTLECTDGENTVSADVGVTVEPAPVVSIDAFTASAAVITTGGSVTLLWSVSHASSCTALDGTPAWSATAPDPESGSAVIQIESEGEYTFTLQCTDGENVDSVSVVVTVTDEDVVAIDSFTGSAGEITAGESVTLDWTVSHATSCTALDGTPDWIGITPDSESGNAVIVLDEPGEYSFTLQCTDGENTVSASVQVSVEAAPVVTIESFTASAAAIAAGESVTLAWVVSNATSCTARNGTAAWRAIDPNADGGNADIRIDAEGDYTFTLRCTDGEETVSAQVAVSVAAFLINAGLNDAWFNLATAGQGVFVNVFPVIGKVFIAIFTYDVERPPGNVHAILGEPGHRWVTAFGDFAGNEAVLEAELTEGGIFDSEEPAVTQTAGYGTITLTFIDCNNLVLTYEFPGLGIEGEMQLTRLAPDNVDLCEALAVEG